MSTESEVYEEFGELVTSGVALRLPQGIELRFKSKDQKYFVIDTLTQKFVPVRSRGGAALSAPILSKALSILAQVRSAVKSEAQDTGEEEK